MAATRDCGRFDVLSTRMSSIRVRNLARYERFHASRKRKFFHACETQTVSINGRVRVVVSMVRVVDGRVCQKTVMTNTCDCVHATRGPRIIQAVHQSFAHRIVLRTRSPVVATDRVVRAKDAARDARTRAIVMRGGPRVMIVPACSRSRVAACDTTRPERGLVRSGLHLSARQATERWMPMVERRGCAASG